MDNPEVTDRADSRQPARQDTFADGDGVHPVDDHGYPDRVRIGVVVNVCPVPPAHADAVGARVLVAVAWSDDTVGIYPAAELRHRDPAGPTRPQHPRRHPSTPAARTR